MSDDAAMQAIRTLAGSMQNLQRQAAQQYKPVVDDILRTRSRDTQHIEHTLDGLLDFCGYDPVLRMYKNLCRHYCDIDPAATADYIDAYCEYWDSDAEEGSHDCRAQAVCGIQGVGVAVAWAGAEALGGRATRHTWDILS